MTDLVAHEGGHGGLGRVVHNSVHPDPRNTEFLLDHKKVKMVRGHITIEISIKVSQKQMYYSGMIYIFHVHPSKKL